MTDTATDVDDEGFDEYGVRWDCVEKARELLTAEGPFTRLDVDEVLALAARIERYIVTGATTAAVDG